VWHDAKHIADHIVTQRKYLAYYDDEQREAHGRRENSVASVENTSADSRVHKVSEMGVN
jgi:putative flavoprotein involved in K+ transport